MYSTYKYVSRPGNAPDSAVGLDPWAGLGETWFYTPTELAGIRDGSNMIEGIRIVEMKLWDFHLLIRFDMGTAEGWLDDIELDPDFPPTQVPFSPLGFQVRNFTATEIARYEIDAYW